MRRWLVRAGAAALGPGLALSPPIFAETPEETRAAAELKTLRGQIETTETRIETARDEAATLTRQLRDNETATAGTRARLAAIQKQIAAQQARLRGLQTEQDARAQALTRQKQALAAQLRAAHRNGRNHALRLILNQEDPARLGRALAYYAYLNQRRARKIEAVRLGLDALRQAQSAVRAETARLAALQVEQEQKLGELRAFRAGREDLIARLQDYLSAKDRELDRLRENERELRALLQELKAMAAPPAGGPPFDSLRGKLAWPARGRLLKQFGNPKKAGLKWRGVLIGAEAGSRVNAVSGGRIIFADRFRNLGLLLIIDHGDGFLSLYGHNRDLLKTTGERVQTGEQIATVGDSGGQRDTALYFEIRKGKQPLNPAEWCGG